MKTKIPEKRFGKVPNIFWDLIPQMKEAEYRIMGVAIQKIFGYSGHLKEKDPEPISLTQFEKGTGMSRQGVLDGIEQAEKRGWLIQVDKNGPRGTSRYIIAYDEPAQSAQPVNAVDQSGSQPVNAVDTHKTTDSKMNVSKETLRSKKAASPPPIITGRSGNSDDPPTLNTDGYTALELWFYENKAGRQPISDSQRGQFSAPNMYVDPANNTPIDNGPSVNKLFEDKAYLAWLVEDVIPFMKRTKGAKLKNTAYYKPAATDLLKQMRDVKRFYEWKAKQPEARFRPLRKIISSV